MTGTKLVLLGGGHSHAIALKYFARHPIPETTLQLVNPSRYALYSGMIPGYLSGQYQREACQIDLQRLAECAGANLIQDEAIALDLDLNQVICKTGTIIEFDRLSINTGSHPAVPESVQLDDRILAIKPLAQFLDQWDRIASTCHSIAIVGAGFGGIEVALNLQARWGNALEIHLFCQGETVAPQANRSLQRFLSETLASRKLEVHLRSSVVEARRHNGGVLLTVNTIKTIKTVRMQAYDAVIFVTPATAPSWIRSSGLATDAGGFIAIDRTLRSISHPQVFAAGDTAALQSHGVGQALPKSGVFAVRQGKPLAQNLVRSVGHQPLISAISTLLASTLPGRNPTSLSLLNLGDELAIGSYGELSITAPLWQPILWRLKDLIDRRFIRSFYRFQKEI